MHSAGDGSSGRGTTSSPRTGRCPGASRCIPAGDGDDLELWIDPRYVDAGYGWSFPARDELRIGVGSFDPHDPVKQPTLRLVEDVDAGAARLPGQLDPAPHPAGGRGRRVLRRRQRGPLPAADRRGHPDGVLLRDRARARAARGARGPPGQGGRAEALRRLQRLTPLEVRVDLPRPAVDPAPARAPAGPPDAAVHAPQALALGVRALPGDRAAAVRHPRARPPLCRACRPRRRQAPRRRWRCPRRSERGRAATRTRPGSARTCAGGSPRRGGSRSPCPAWPSRRRRRPR